MVAAFQNNQSYLHAQSIIIYVRPVNVNTTEVSHLQ